MDNPSRLNNAPHEPVSSEIRPYATVDEIFRVDFDLDKHL